MSIKWGAFPPRAEILPLPQVIIIITRPLAWIVRWWPLVPLAWPHSLLDNPGLWEGERALHLFSLPLTYKAWQCCLIFNNMQVPSRKGPTALYHMVSCCFLFLLNQIMIPLQYVVCDVCLYHIYCSVDGVPRLNTCAAGSLFDKGTLGCVQQQVDFWFLTANILYMNIF